MIGVFCHGYQTLLGVKFYISKFVDFVVVILEDIHYAHYIMVKTVGWVVGSKYSECIGTTYSARLVV